MTSFQAGMTRGRRDAEEVFAQDSAEPAPGHDERSAERDMQ
jgi:hypothetical protein